MKKFFGKFLSVLTAASLAISSGAVSVYAQDDDYLCLDATQTIFTGLELDKNVYIDGTYGADETTLDELEGVTYQSSNENVISLDENGKITVNNYGITTVSATYEGKTATKLISVIPSEREFDGNYITAAGSALGRTPAYGEERELRGGYSGDNVLLRNIIYANEPSNGGNKTGGCAVANTIMEAWFYDNGKTTDAEAGIQFNGSNSMAGTGTVGVLRSADTTYRLSGIITYQNGNTAILKDANLTDEGSKDTGIARTKGWHQVTLVNTKSGANSKYTMYLDGECISEGYSDSWPGRLHAYAGTNTDHTAKFKNVIYANYASLDSVNISTEATGLKASYAYQGTTPAAQYQWYEQTTDGWTAIENATDATFTDVDTTKTYRVGVKVTDTTLVSGSKPAVQFTTNELFSDEYSASGLGLSIADTDTRIVGLGTTRKITGTYMFSSLDTLSGVTYASDNENVLSVDAQGNLTANNYGTAKISVTYEGKTVSALFTVTTAERTCGDNGYLDASGSVIYPAYSAVRRIAGGYSTDGGFTNRFQLRNILWINDSGVDSGHSLKNTVLEGWFYDNGQTTDAEAGIQFQGHASYAGTGVLGVLKSSDTTYRVSGGWAYNNGYTAVVCDEHITNEASTDTGIARTAGWHQVSLINTFEGNTQVYRMYLDGTFVKEYRDGDTWPGIVYAYAGGNTNHVAEFKMPSYVNYNTVSSVTITADANGLEASYVYHGNTPTAQYQWYEQTNGAWTAIDGATNAIFTDIDTTKVYRVGVKVSDTIGDAAITTNEYYSDLFNATTLGLSISDTETKIVGLDGAHKVHGTYMFRDISTLSGVTYASDNKKVLTVDEQGNITLKGYGVAKVTVTYQGETASTLIVVTDAEQGFDGGYQAASGSVIYPAYEDVREIRGEMGSAISPEHIRTKNICYSSASGRGTENTVLSAWFYDNGQNKDAEVGLQFQAYASYSGTGLVGVLKSTDTTYRLAGITTYHGSTGWTGVVFKSQLDDATDTGIARKAGWHQVTLVNTKAKDGNCVSALYLDGTFLREYVSDHAWPGIINAYAGADADHVAKFTKPMFVNYTKTVAETTVEYDNNNVVISAADAIENGVLRVVTYDETTSGKVFKGVVSYTVNCDANATVSIEVGELTNGQVLMLWGGANDMVPLCKATVVNLGPTEVVNGND